MDIFEFQRLLKNKSNRTCHKGQSHYANEQLVPKGQLKQLP